MSERIALNYRLQAVNTEDGTMKLTGKCGYQTMNDKADRYTNTNLASILTLWKAGELKDLEGNQCVFGDGRTPVIDVYATVSLIGDGEIEAIGGVRNSAGGTATMPTEAPAASGSDEPF
jgi:hypothetical protein